MDNRAVFLDLNGTLVMPVQVQIVDDYHLLPGVVESVRRLNDAGFVCPVVTVQSRIEKGMYSAMDFSQWFERFQTELAEQAAHVVGPYVCPHRPGTVCECGKPKTALYRQAAQEHDIDLTASFVIGDGYGDVGAGIAIGAQSLLLLTGWGRRAASECGAEASYISPDLEQAVDWIIGGREKTRM